VLAAAVVRNPSAYYVKLVMSTESFHRTLPDVIVCPISSQPRYFERPGPGDLPLRSWRTVGLHYPSTVRVSRSFAVQKKLLGRTLGKLADEDLRTVEDTLRDALGL